MSKKKKKVKRNGFISKIFVVVILLISVLNIFRYAGYFKRDIDDKIDISVHNETNVELNYDIYIDENNVLYMSEDDVREYLDQELYYEKDDSNMRRYVSISQNKILEITEGQNHMFVNGVREKIKGAVLDRDGVFYFPISELENVYNIKIDYLKEENRLNIEKLSQKKIVAVVNRTTKLKYKMTNISKTIDILNQGDSVTIVQEMQNGWVRIKTSNYIVGYIKKSKLIDVHTERYDLENNDYKDFNIDSANIVEITDSTYEDFNDKISRYNDRQVIEKDILDKVVTEIGKQPQYVGVKINVTSINNINDYDKFLRELRAYVNNIGVCLIVVNVPNMDEKELKNIVDIVI